MTVNITIIGLGRIGASMGLALAAHKEQVTITGHDKAPEAAKAAKKLGAVDRIAFNLPASVEEAAVVVLSLPFDQVQPTLKAIAQDVREDAVILDTSPTKAPVAGWVKELLPPSRHYVGLTPAINSLYLNETARGIHAAHADLFQRSLVAVSAPPGTPEAALKLAADFVTLLGAAPYFTDLAEADGVMASAHILPQILAAGIIDSTIRQPGWDDIRKLAGPAFASVTAQGSSEEPGALVELVMQGKQNILRVLEDALASLSDMREEIMSDDAIAFGKRIAGAHESRAKWITERAGGDWLVGQSPRAEFPSSRDIMMRQIGGLDKLFRRRGKEPKG